MTGSGGKDIGGSRRRAAGRRQAWDKYLGSVFRLISIGIPARSHSRTNTCTFNRATGNVLTYIQREERVGSRVRGSAVKGGKERGEETKRREEKKRRLGEGGESELDGHVDEAR